MKKLLVCTLAFLLIFSFAACTSEEIPQETENISEDTTAAEAVSTERTANDWVEFIASKVPFDDTMTTVGAEQAMAVYGIFEEDGYNGDCALYISTMATPEEIAVFEADDAMSLDDLCKKVEERLEKQKASYADYAPEELPKLESAVVKVVGDMIIVVVSADNALAFETVK